MIRRIREQVVVLINPISNPDGRDKMVDWFYRYLKGKTDRTTLPRQSPPYWSKYTFVDINRDTHQQTHETTKAVHRMFHEWHPTVVHDLHEGSPLMMTWNGTGPYNPNIDPITYSEFLDLSFHEVEAMTAMGMPGVSTWNFGEAFAHLYLDSVAMNHNSIGRGYETFGNGSAETELRMISPSASTMEWYRPLPARRGGHVVGSRQSQLPGNRRSCGIGRDRQPIQGNVAQLLQEGMGFLAERPDAAALRVSDSGRSRRSGASGANDRPAHGPANRSCPSAEPDSAQGRKLSRREPSWFVSISHTATMRLICSRRSTTRRMEKRPTMTFPGSFPPTIICRRSLLPMRPSVTRR